MYESNKKHQKYVIHEKCYILRITKITKNIMYIVKCRYVCLN